MTHEAVPSLRVWSEQSRHGDVIYDLFDISAQVTEDGVAGAFKALQADVFFGAPDIAPACCRSVHMNEEDQLQLHVGDKKHTVDSVNLLCQVIEKPKMKVIQDMDGIGI